MVCFEMKFKIDSLNQQKINAYCNYCDHLIKIVDMIHLKLQDDEN